MINIEGLIYMAAYILLLIVSGILLVIGPVTELRFIQLSLIVITLFSFIRMYYVDKYR